MVLKDKRRNYLNECMCPSLEAYVPKVIQYSALNIYLLMNSKTCWCVPQCDLSFLCSLSFKHTQQSIQQLEGVPGGPSCWWKRSGQQRAPALNGSSSDRAQSGWFPCWGRVKTDATSSHLQVVHTSNPPQGAWRPRGCKRRGSPPKRERGLRGGHRRLSCRGRQERALVLLRRPPVLMICTHPAFGQKGLWGIFWISASPEIRATVKLKD